MHSFALHWCQLQNNLFFTCFIFLFINYFFRFVDRVWLFTHWICVTLGLNLLKLVMINWQIFSCHPSWTVLPVCYFSAKKYLRLSAFFHLHKLNSQLRVDFKNILEMIVSIHSKNYIHYTTSLPCETDCIQRCHSEALSMSALWLDLPYQLNKAVQTSTERTSIVKTHLPLQTIILITLLKCWFCKVQDKL